MRETIDLNCDLGESFGNWRIETDEQIIPLLTAACVACGFHAGDPLTMLESVRSCHRAGVAIGAHGDVPNAVEVAQTIRRVANELGCRLEAPGTAAGTR